MQPFATGGLEPAFQSQALQHRMGQERRLLQVRPCHPLSGVEIKDHAVGLVGAVGGRVPRMELDGIHLRGRDERLEQ
jgi:hypothetical protein